MEKAASLSMRPSLSDSPQFSHSLPARAAVSFYRSKFIDCATYAVPNSYPNIDLL